jgi:hypothetical protein
LLWVAAGCRSERTRDAYRSEVGKLTSERPYSHHRWAEIRRIKEVDGPSIHEIVRRAGHDRNTVRRALRREGPPRHERAPRPSRLDPFKDKIDRLLQDDPRIPPSGSAS